MSREGSATSVNFSRASRVPTLTFFLIALLAPAATLPGMLFYYDVTPKVVLVLAGAAAALCFRPRTTANPPRWLTGLLGAQAASVVLATVFSPNFELSFGGSNWRRLGLVTSISLIILAWLVCRAATAGGSLLPWLRVLAASGLVPAAYGVAQYFGWDPWLPAAAYHAGEGSRVIVRPPSSLGHAIYFANYLVSVAFAALAVSLADPSRPWRRLGCVAATLAGVAIVLSGTRAALAGLAAGTVFVLLQLRPSSPRRLVTAAVLGAAVLVAFSLSPAGEKLRNRVLWALEEPPGGARLLLWQDTLQMARACWWRGAGLETYPAVFPKFQSVALSRQYPDFYHESPHNIFLDALVSQGALGLLSLILLVAFAFRAAWRSRQPHPFLAVPLGAALVASVVAHCFASFTIPTLLAFYWTVALIAALQPTPPARPRNGKLVPLAGFVLAGALVIFAVRLAVADRALAVTRMHLDAGRLSEAIAAHDRYLRWRPPGMDAELWYSRRLLMVAQNSPDFLTRTRAFTEALLAARRATQSAEQPANAWYNLALLEAARDNPTATENALRAAAVASPTWYKPRWMLARLYQHLGHPEQARREAKEAASLYGGTEPEIRQSLGVILRSATSGK